MSCSLLHRYQEVTSGTNLLQATAVLCIRATVRHKHTLAGSSFTVSFTPRQVFPEAFLQCLLQEKKREGEKEEPGSSIALCSGIVHPWTQRPCLTDGPVSCNHLDLPSTLKHCPKCSFWPHLPLCLGTV